MRIKLITAPATLPVTIDEVASHIRVSDDPDETYYLTSLIDSAAAYIDGVYGMGFCMMPQTLELMIDQFTNTIKIPVYPVSSVVSIKYIDTEGTEQTLEESKYTLNSYGNMPTVAPSYNEQWPSTRNISGAVKIQFIAGFSALPQDLKHAVLLLVGHWYDNREAATSSGTFSETPFAVKAILNKYAVAGIA